LPNYITIIQTLNATIEALRSGNSSSASKFQLLVTYQLTRQIVTTIAEDTSFVYPSANSYLNITQL